MEMRANRAPRRHAAAALKLINVSNGYSQPSHDQKCRTLLSSRHSENSGAINNSPHFGQDGRPK
jgi:hypothetical protein